MSKWPKNYIGGPKVWYGNFIKIVEIKFNESLSNKFQFMILGKKPGQPIILNINQLGKTPRQTIILNLNQIKKNLKK